MTLTQSAHNTTDYWTLMLRRPNTRLETAPIVSHFLLTHSSELFGHISAVELIHHQLPRLAWPVWLLRSTLMYYRRNLSLRALRKLIVQSQLLLCGAATSPGCPTRASLPAPSSSSSSSFRAETIVCDNETVRLLNADSRTCSESSDQFLASLDEALRRSIHEIDVQVEAIKSINNQLAKRIIYSPILHCRRSSHYVQLSNLLLLRMRLEELDLAADAFVYAAEAVRMEANSLQTAADAASVAETCRQSPLPPLEHSMIRIPVPVCNALHASFELDDSDDWHIVDNCAADTLVDTVHYSHDAPSQADESDDDASPSKPLVRRRRSRA